MRLPLGPLLVSLIASMAACGRWGFDLTVGPQEGLRDASMGRADGSTADSGAGAVLDTTDLIALYHMNETGWTGVEGEIVDSSGGGHHGAARNGLSTDTGLLARCGRFVRAGDQHASFGDDPAFELDMPFTILMWINLSELPSVTVGSYRLISKSLADGEQREWRWELSRQGDFLTFVTSPDGTDTERAGAISFTPMDVGTWVHVAFVAEPDGTYRDYRNGAEISSGMFAETAIFHGGADMRIGARDPSSRGTNALIDEVAIFGRALSGAEIESVYQAQAGGDPGSEILGR